MFMKIIDFCKENKTETDVNGLIYFNTLATLCVYSTYSTVGVISIHHTPKVMDMNNEQSVKTFLYRHS
jgi:hypothetical protein